MTISTKMASALRFPRFLSLLSIFLATLGSPCLWAADLSGLLYRFSGSVEVSADGGAVWKPAKAGMGLAQRDQVRTGAGSSALLLLQDGSFYHMKEKCALEILDLSYDRKLKALKSSFKIQKGKFLGRVSKLLSGSEASFKSPTALVAVRGTELSLDVADNGDTEIYLNEGRIVVTDFVQERALPEDQRGLLLDLLHEVALKNGQAVRVTGSGIKRDRKSKAQIQTAQDEFAELGRDGEAAQKQESSLSYEESQSRRLKSREEVLK